jgi:Na+/melibiose symporter-like transporter
MTHQKYTVPFYRKLSWGMGGFGENLANNAVLYFAFPIYQIALGVPPIWITAGMLISRILDAFTDPLMGNITDNTHSRWGRRRPWILIGAVLMSIFFALMWMMPAEASKEVLGTYLGIMCVLFYVGFTFFVIPFSALGIEMVEDYDERTRLQIFRMVPAYLGGFLMSFFYKWALNPHFKHPTLPTEVNGARTVGIGAAIVILICCVLPALFTKERFSEKTKTQERIKIGTAIKLTLTDKPYLMVVSTAFMVFIALFFVMPLMTYIGIFYIFSNMSSLEEAKRAAGDIGPITAGFCIVFQIIATFLIGVWARRVDKKTLLIGGLAIAAVGYLSSWFFFTPAHPYWQIIPMVVIQVGLAACWVVNGSFVADICDFDELKTGQRREGMYSAVFGFIYKCAIGIVALLSGLFLTAAGIKGGVLEHLDSLSSGLLMVLRLAYALFPAVCLLIGILIMRKYPLTKKKVEEIQQQLKDRRGDVVST